MVRKITLKELLEKGQVFAPCIHDCFSARAVEVSGFKAMLLSGGVTAYSMIGMPDMGLMTADELIWATNHITDASPLPLIVDAEDGYGESPLNVYRTTARLAKAGAMALSIDDTTGIRGWERRVVDKGEKNHEVVDTEVWLAKLKGALTALEGTDCLLIARTEAKAKYGLDEAIDRCMKAEALGAHLTTAIGIDCLGDCKKIAEKVKGWKMYPDVFAKRGEPDVELKDVDKLGFRLVTTHYVAKGAMWGMIEYGRQNLKNKSTCYSMEHDMGGLMPEYGLKHNKWLDLEESFQNDLTKSGKE